MKQSELPKDDPRYQPLYIHAGWKRNMRKKEKIMKKFRWFKPGDGGEGAARSIQPTRRHEGGKKVLKDGNMIEVATVVFWLES